MSGEKSGPAHLRHPALTAALAVLLPGWGQAMLGPKRLGRVLVGIAALAWLALVAAGVWYLADPLGLLGFLARPPVLATAIALAAVGAVVEVVTVVDLERRWRPERAGGAGRPRLRQVAMGVGAAAMVACLGLVATGAGAARNLIVQVFAQGAGLEPVEGRYNIAVLGIDEQDGYVRPDSIWLASIDALSGQATAFALPRELSGFTFEASSPLAAQFPAGYSCEQKCSLNWLYHYAETTPGLYPHSAHAGIDAMQDAIESITGLQVGATVMVTFDGLEQVVDALGGVRVQVNRPVVLGAVSPPEGGPATYIGEVQPGVHQLDGATALLFVRSRLESDNSDRIARQSCVMKAIASQSAALSDPLALWRVATSTADLVRTTIPVQSVPALARLAYRPAQQSLTTFVLGAPLVTSLQDPDLPYLHAAVREALATGTITPPPAQPTIGGTRVEAKPFEGDAADPSPSPGAGAAGPTASAAPDAVPSAAPKLDLPVCQVP